MFDISMVSDEWIEVGLAEPQRCRDCHNVIVCERCYVAACEAEAAGYLEMFSRVEG